MSKPAYVLIGPPGVGKSTVGKLLAERLGVPFEDSDEVIADSFGMSISDIFAKHGENEFRQAEAETVSDLLRDNDGVVALGGGAVMAPATQINLAKYVRAGGNVIFLDVSPQAVSSRLHDGGRPLLTGDDATTKWKSIYDARKETYQLVSTQQIDTSELNPGQIADKISRSLRLAQDDGSRTPPSFCGPQGSQNLVNDVIRVKVPVSEPYDVIIGNGVIGELPTLLKPGVNKVFLIYPEPLLNLMEPVKAVLHAAGLTVVAHSVPDTEAQKTSDVLVHCWELCALSGITRSDAVVAVGGGATTDLGGFVAATWLRGIQVVHVPTSLLAMVDAAVGGKTGINTPEGKNLVGSFYQPNGVICDLEMLKTLPPRDFSAGLAEVIKCGFISDHRILELIKYQAGELHPWQGASTDVETWKVVAELIQRAVAVKAHIAGDDVFEKGAREFLNYGHTLGHAIEHAEDFKWRHGEAVAVGMVFVAELARLSGFLTDDEVELHRDLLSSVGLPITYNNATLTELLPAMQRDKKTRGAKLRFIVLEKDSSGQFQPTRLEGPNQELLAQAFALISQPSFCGKE